MRSISLQPNLVTFSALIIAYQRGGIGERALGFLVEMRERGWGPSVRS